MDPSYSFDRTIELLTRAFAELESEATREVELADLSMKQIVYLEMISRLEKPTFGDLAKRLSVTRPSVTSIIAKLIQKGYVQRIQSSEDRRSFYILLTEKGQALSEMHKNLHHKIAEHLSRNLSEDELHQLGLLLNKIVNPVA